MVHILSVAEKPSVAKELSRILNNGVPPPSRRGASPFNPIHSVNNVEFNNSHGHSMSITSVTGHLCGIDFDKAYRNWNSCHPSDLFSLPIHKTVKNEPLGELLRNEAPKHQVLFIWTDCDLEGENIGYEVISVCTGANPRLDVFRARFSALIPRDITRACRLPARPNQQMTDAVDARQELDLRAGAAFTRWQTLRVQVGFSRFGCDFDGAMLPWLLELVLSSLNHTQLHTHTQPGPLSDSYLTLYPLFRSQPSDFF